MNLEKKDQPYSLNISEVSDFEKSGSLNARKFLFQNTLRQSARSRVLNTADSGKCGSLKSGKLLFQNTHPESTCLPVLSTADTTMATFLLKIAIDPTHIELGKISVSEI